MFDYDDDEKHDLLMTIQSLYSRFKLETKYSKTKRKNKVKDGP